MTSDNKQFEFDYYKILEVNRHASQSEIEEAWKKKLREYDVDKLKYFGEKLRNLAKEETQLINEAYEVLSDPEKRKAYNQTIGRRIGRKNSLEQDQDLKRYVQKQADIHNNRAIQFWQERQYEKAIVEWNKAIKIAPSLAILHHNLANACLNLERYDKAIEIWEKTIELHPNLAEAYNNLGCAYYKIGEPDLAAKNWKKVLELNPDCEEARKNLEMLVANSIISPDTDVSPYSIESNYENSNSKGRLSRVFSKFRKKT